MKKCFLSLIFIVIVLQGYSQQPSAADILSKAERSASEEHKNILVIFHASWCGWCRKMDSSLNDPGVKNFFYKNYVVTRLTILESADKKNMENPGALELYNKYGGDNQGIPYWLILDKEGKLLADSRLSNGENSGCPASQREVDLFINVLEKTASTTPDILKAVEKRFRKNEY